MVGFLLKLRWLAVVIALFGALHATSFIAIGVIRGIDAYRMILHGPPWTGEQMPGVQLARSIDAFLLALVFFVFSIGVTELFLHSSGAAREQVPEWMRVKNLSELKFLIWEAILAALVVASMEGFIAPAHEIDWNALILPIGLLILAAGLFLARKAH